MSLSIRNRQRRVPVSSPRLQRLASRALSALGRSDRDVHLTVVNDREIRRLNRRYLGVRGPTDVLAFGLELGASTRAALHQARAPGLAPARARRNSPFRKIPSRDESPGSRPAASRALRESPSLESPGPSRLLGEVIVSAETAARQAARLGIPVALEMELLLVHGLLHLVGYDDHIPEEARLMHERERGILSAGRRRALPPRLWTGLLNAP